MLIPNSLNSNHQELSSLECTTHDEIKIAFEKWIGGRTQVFSVESIMACMDNISLYAQSKKILKGSIWEISNRHVFQFVYQDILNTKLLRVTEKKLYNSFISVGKLYLKFLKEKSKIDTAADVAVVCETVQSMRLPLLETHINPQDVASWLLTQPNENGTLYLENVIRQYISALSNAPSKLDIPMDAAMSDVFSCSTSEDLMIRCNIYKAASNYKKVNKRTSGSFSAGMSCLKRYLEFVSLSKGTDEITTTQIKETNSIQSIDEKIIDQVTSILSSRFSNGYRLNSPIELSRFRSFGNQTCELPLSDDEVKKYISACGIMYDGKVYVVTTQTREEIKEFAKNYFATGAQVIFFSEFYAKHENWLFQSCVISQSMLIELLRELFSTLYFTNTYFGLVNSTVFSVLEKELLRVWGSDILLTYSDLAEKVRYIPLDRIKFALGQNGDFIWNSMETFSHISCIKILDDDRETIRGVATQECNLHSYVSIADLPLGETVSQNDLLSNTAIHNAVYRICLSDKFDKRGKIITRKGDVFDALTITKEYCRTVNQCSLDDLLNFEKELTGEIHRWVPMEAGNTVLVRISKDEYVADRYVHFNVSEIDGAISLFVNGDYLPLKAFTTFGVFSDCGQQWNLFLLESYCRRFSLEFRFDTLSVNSRNAGAIIRKSCDLNYTEIMTDAVASSEIDLNETTIGKFLYNHGYTGRSSTAKSTEIREQAKAIRERRG